MSDTEFKMPPETAAVHAVFHRHVRYYPELSEAFDGNDTAAIVFAEMLYLDALRINRSAQWFTQTDKQLAERLSMGVRKVQAARDLITAQGIELFETELHGMPAVKHYRGNYERIGHWLEARGVGRVQIAENRQTGLPKTGKQDLTKQANKIAENRAPLKNSVQVILNDDDDARTRAREIHQLLECYGIEGDNRLRLTAQLMSLCDAVEIVRWQCDRSAHEFGRDQGKIVKKPVGLLVTRLRDEYAARTGNEPRYVDPGMLADVRAMFAVGVEARS